MSERKSKFFDLKNVKKSVKEEDGKVVLSMSLRPEDVETFLSDIKSENTKRGTKFTIVLGNKVAEKTGKPFLTAAIVVNGVQEPRDAKESKPAGKKSSKDILSSIV